MSRETSLGKKLSLVMLVMSQQTGTKVQCQMEKGERMVENENWGLLFEFSNVAEIKFKTC